MDTLNASRVLASSRVPHPSLYLIGTFNTGVTVLSQQVRALNLVWALIEGKQIAARRPGEKTIAGDPSKVAIVGAGFAGLSVAAGLIKKGAHAEITIFEQRDTMLPLQNGSDTRWLHPHIYEWPAEGSETNAAMLPVLNWTAARASDVAVQVLLEWDALTESNTAKIKLYCNTRHLQIYEQTYNRSRLQIEWIGEERNPRDGTTNTTQLQRAIGNTDLFDLVILAIGFGLEREGVQSYWRNDTYGQPSLEKPRLTYLVSGQGDGAMIDLLRLRVSQYRQDRILRELFGDAHHLLPAIERLYQEYDSGKRTDIFAAFEELSALCPEDFERVLSALEKRLRRDTDVILHLKVRKLAELLDAPGIRISFQNKLLVYLLYKCGGFVPSTVNEDELKGQHSIPEEQVIRRHGSDREKQLKAVLSTALFEAIWSHHQISIPSPFMQFDTPSWPGGYFGYTGLTIDAENAERLDPSVTLEWRKEYLPVPTGLLAAAFCSSIAGILREHHMDGKRLRVTLHRAVSFGEDELLQQCSEYFGLDPTSPKESTAARTFPAHNATIGLAYDTRRIVRSCRGVDPQILLEIMKKLDLNKASSKMSPDVHFLLAMPMLQPEAKFIKQAPVAAVVFVDSTAPNFFVEDELLIKVVAAAQGFIDGLERMVSAKQKGHDRSGGVFNMPLNGLSTDSLPPKNLPPFVANVLEFVPDIFPPMSKKPFQFTFEYSDFIPVKTGW